VPSAGQPLRQQVESRFEVLPVSDGLVLRPRQPMAGIRTLEVRDGQLAIDGREAEADDLERRIGAAAAAPVRSLLELDPDELRDLFGLSTSLPEPPDQLPPADQGAMDQQMAERRAEIERQQAEIRQRIEEELSRRADDVQRRPEDLARELERAGRRGRHRRDSDARVVMGTPVHVEKDETTGDVVAVGGSITVEGEVDGDAVAVGGSNHITGTVEGTAVSVGGSVHLGPEARVMGDVVSVGGTVEREPGAEVMGQVTEVSLWQGLGGSFVFPWNVARHGTIDGGYFDGALLRFVRCIVFVLVLILFGALASAVARNPLERISAVAGEEPWKAAVVGLLAVLLFLPAILIVLVLLAVSIVGIPLLLLWPFGVLACVFAAVFGYFCSAHALARWSERRFGWRVAGPIATMVLGVFLLQGAWLMARLVDVVDSSHNFAGFLRIMLLLFWMLVNLSAALVGVGSLILARRRGPIPAQPLLAASPPPVSSALTSTRAAEPAHPAAVPTVEDADWEEPFAGFEPPEPETRAAAEDAEAPTAADDEEKPEGGLQPA
jgi:hypothetical protein